MSALLRLESLSLAASVTAALTYAPALCAACRATSYRDETSTVELSARVSSETAVQVHIFKARRPEIGRELLRKQQSQ